MLADPGTCGVAGAAGVFTLTGHEGKTFTVNVDPTTPFLEAGVTDPTFANVCVGGFVLAKGTVTDTTVAATQVFIAPVVTATSRVTSTRARSITRCSARSPR